MGLVFEYFQASLILSAIAVQLIMRTEHKLFLVLTSTPKSRAKVCAQWGMSLSPPVAC